jgi:arginyl-tRNA synthetase
VNINKVVELVPGVKTAAVIQLKRMEDGDEDAFKNWRVWRSLSAKKYAEAYNRLDVNFAVYAERSKVWKKWPEYVLE